jgi:hypothetical protein
MENVESQSTFTVERGLRAVAGFFVILSVVLAVSVNLWWLAFTACVGLNLFQSAFSDWCPMMWFLQKLGLKTAGQCAARR